ncbi:MAG TPA: RNA polymerase sigma factor [bacterium]|nr:RNA polymerase sigma factor [bacterium]
MTNKTDEQLVADYLAGDNTAINFLVERYLVPIFNFIWRYVHSSADAEDVVQEVFVKAWRHLARFDQTKKFKAWLFAIARNAALDFLKKKKTLNFSDLVTSEGDNPAIDNLADPAPLPADLFDQSNLAETLNHTMSELPASYQQVLELYYHEELNLREISEVLDAPVDTIKSRHRRALIALRNILLKNKE